METASKVDLPEEITLYTGTKEEMEAIIFDHMTRLESRITERINAYLLETRKHLKTAGGHREYILTGEEIAISRILLMI